MFKRERCRELAINSAREANTTQNSVLTCLRKMILLTDLSQDVERPNSILRLQDESIVCGTAAVDTQVF